VLLDVSKAGWYHDLNRDPRTACRPGLNRVIKRTGKLMQRAWQQVQKVYEGNRIIRTFQFTIQVSLRYTAGFSLSLSRTAAGYRDAGSRQSAGQPTTIRSN